MHSTKGLIFQFGALLGVLFYLTGHVEASSASGSSSSACVSTAVTAGRRLLVSQESFYRCYKECARPLLNSYSASSAMVPDFSLNFASLAKSAGIAACSKICFEKIRDIEITDAVTKNPLVSFDKIAQELLKCSAEEVSDGYFASELAQFNIDNLKEIPIFIDPRPRRLFSIFYPDHLQTFWAGMASYDRSSKNCGDILVSMRGALSAYVNNLNLCQHWCLISLAGTANSDSMTSFISLSRCQRSCFFLFRSDPAPAKSLLHPAAEMHHYLQYCLWHTGAHQEAFAHGASYSLLETSDTSVYDYYVGTGKITKDEFKPKPEAIHLKEQLQILNSVLKLSEDLKSGLVEGISVNLASILNAMKVYEPENVKKTSIVSAPAAAMGTCDAAEPTSCKIDSSLARMVGNFSGIDVYRRYVVDNVIGSDQCKQLIGMNNRGGKNGDGYPATKKHGSPYTERESYVGLAAHRLAELAADGIITPEEVILYFKVAENVLEQTKRLHGLKELYFYYVHLVCREAKDTKGDTEGDGMFGEDPSHPIHADNCAIQPNGDCLNNDPLLTPRNYSSVLYLNDDFEGGEFIFAHRPNKTEDRKVNPRCGRLVSFHASEYHGVRAVSQGTRCSLAMWFTLDKAKEETAREYAYKIVSQLTSMRDSVPPEPIGPKISGRMF